jgi:hypothetical protein
LLNFKLQPLGTPSEGENFPTATSLRVTNFSLPIWLRALLPVVGEAGQLIPIEHTTKKLLKQQKLHFRSKNKPGHTSRGRQSDNATEAYTSSSSSSNSSIGLSQLLNTNRSAVHAELLNRSSRDVCSSVFATSAASTTTTAAESRPSTTCRRPGRRGCHWRTASQPARVCYLLGTDM